jgi:hypothetical protein
MSFFVVLYVSEFHKRVYHRVYVRESARFSVQSSELGPPTPSPRKRLLFLLSETFFLINFHLSLPDHIFLFCFFLCGNSFKLRTHFTNLLYFSSYFIIHLYSRNHSTPLGHFVVLGPPRVNGLNNQTEQFWTKRPMTIMPKDGPTINILTFSRLFT